MTPLHAAALLAIEFRTRARESDDRAILACERCRERFQRADGSLVRRVETVAAPVA